jgi:F0F1-type ATP synthase assembly protein I
VARRDALLAGTRFIATGSEFALTVVAGVAVGYYADQYLGTEPWLMLVFTIAGFYGALRRLLWALKKHS